jgi:hypothetical protein
MKITVFRYVTPCSLSDLTEMSQEWTAHVFSMDGRPAYICIISFHLASLCTLKMDAEDYPETLPTFHQSTQYHMRDDTNILSHRQGNFISRPILIILQPIIKLSTNFSLTERSNMYCDSSDVGDVRNI